MSKEKDRESGQVENIVRQLFIVQQKSGQAWLDLSPVWNNFKDAVLHMIDCKAQLGTPFRVIKRTDAKVA